MNRRHVVRLAIAAALFGAALPGVALAQAPGQSKWWNPNQQSARYQDRFHRDMFEGRWVAQNRYDANRGGRHVTLPNFLKIDQERRMLMIADGRNHILQVIAIDNGFHTWNRDAVLLRGDLNGNRLVANGSDPRGRQMRQVMILKNRGNTLVVRTQVQRGRSGHMVEVEKVYQRA